MIRTLPRSGLTLVELIAAIAIIGLMAALAGLSFGAQGPIAPVDGVDAMIAEARRRAIDKRRTITIVVPFEGSTYAVTAMPDGRVVGDSILGIEVMTGRRTNAP